MMRFLVSVCLLFFLLIVSGPAHAFDCAKATSETEKLICSDDTLKQADDGLGQVWQELRNDMSRGNFRSVIKEQRSWLKLRDETCGEGADARRIECLVRETRDRTAELEVMPRSGPGASSALTSYAIVKPARTKRHTAIDLSGVRFANPRKPGEVAFNAEIDKLIAEAPMDQVADYDPPGGLNYSQSMKVTYAGAHLLSVLIATGGYSGGAHSFYATTTVNVSTDDGLLTFDKLFPAAAGERLARACYRVLSGENDKILGKKEKQDRLFSPGVAGIQASVGELDYWTFNERGAVVHFPPYAIGPWVSGSFKCRLPLKLLRKAGAPAAYLPK